MSSCSPKMKHANIFRLLHLNPSTASYPDSNPGPREILFNIPWPTKKLALWVTILKANANTKFIVQWKLRKSIFIITNILDYYAIAFMISQLSSKIIHILFHMFHKNVSFIFTSSSLLFDPYNKNCIRTFLSKMKVFRICFRIKINLLVHIRSNYDLLM